MKPALPFWRYSLQLVLLGAVHALCFAPEPLPGLVLPYVQVAALACLATYIFNASSVKQAALAGLLFGLGQFTVGLYWLYISLHWYGGLPSPMAAGAVLLLAAAEALFVTAAAALARWLCGDSRSTAYGRQLLIAATWASCWAGAEWLRGTLFTGFPWLGTGYAHADGPLSGWAPIFGVYGLAWLSAYIAGTIALLARARGTSAEAPAATAVALGIVLAVAGVALGQISWSQPAGAPLLARLAQGNIPQSEKFDPQLMQKGLDTYARLAALPPKQAGADPKLIILPETVMPMFQDSYSVQLWRQWLAIAQERNATIIMGIPLHTRQGDADRYTNSAIAFDSHTPAEQLLAGTLPMHYDKHHLVPFGEFVPPGFRWFVDAMHIPLGDFDRGAPRQRAFALDGQLIAPNICYEDVFGEEIIQAVADSATQGPGATILVNISNLAWFGNSWALRQHLQISRMRAMETARPMLRATNTGMTAAIDPDGTVRAVLPAQTVGVLDVEVQGTRGLTPYVRWGNSPMLAWFALFLLMGLYLLGRGKRTAQ